MENRGRKKGSTDAQAKNDRRRLLAEYERLVQDEKTLDYERAKHLPTKYYVEKLFAAHIVSWSKSYINKVITNRHRNDQ